MGNTASNRGMRDAILSVAAKLFYDKGYDATSFQEIAVACQITKPLITYHFQSKVNLAGEIHASSVKRRKNMITNCIYEHYGTYDVQLGTAVELRYFLHMLKEDPKAFRFYHQRLNSSFDDNFTTPNMSLFKAHERRYRLDLDDGIDELTMSAIAAKAAGNALNVAYFLGKINCSFEDFCDYSIRLPFKTMNVSTDQIDMIISTSKEIFKNIHFPVAHFELLL